MKVFDFKKYLYGLKGRLNADEGIVFGDGNTEISSVQVSWTASLESIENAGRTGANLMLIHETLLLPSRDMPLDYLSWPANRNRIKALATRGISVIRFHGTMDEICVLDDFAGALGLDEPSVSEPGYIKLYDIAPAGIEELAAAVKKSLGMERIRVVAPFNPPEKIKRVALPWGGMGLFLNASYQAELLKHEPDAFISGEADSYAMGFAADSGIYLIETGHEISENIGIKNFSERISGELEDVKVSYFENKPPFRYE